MSNKYGNIINLPHHVSEKHPQMPGADRAAQFAPFAALSGFGAAITETGRQTDEKIELDEYEMAALNDRLYEIQRELAQQPLVAVTWFVPDEKKTSGAYVTRTGTVKKIDEYKRVVLMADGTRIPIDDIVGIDIAKTAGEEGKAFVCRYQPN